MVDAGQISFMTRGGNLQYRHKFVNYTDAAIQLESGWYGWFADVVRIDNFSGRLFMPLMLPTDVTTSC